MHSCRAVPPRVSPFRRSPCLIRRAGLVRGSGQEGPLSLPLSLGAPAFFWILPCVSCSLSSHAYSSAEVHVSIVSLGFRCSCLISVHYRRHWALWWGLVHGGGFIPVLCCTKPDLDLLMVWMGARAAPGSSACTELELSRSKVIKRLQGEYAERKLTRFSEQEQGSKKVCFRFLLLVQPADVAVRIALPRDLLDFGFGPPRTNHRLPVMFLTLLPGLDPTVQGANVPPPSPPVPAILAEFQHPGALASAPWTNWTTPLVLSGLPGPRGTVTNTLHLLLSEPGSQVHVHVTWPFTHTDRNSAGTKEKHMSPFLPYSICTEGRFVLCSGSVAALQQHGPATDCSAGRRSLICDHLMSHRLTSV